MGNGKKNYVEKEMIKNLNGQIIRKDSYKTFVEVIAPSDSFKQVTMNFITHDGKKPKPNQTGKVSFYFSIPEFLAFCRRITNREIRIVIENDRKRCLSGNNTYGEKVGSDGIIRYSGMKLTPDMKKDKEGRYSMALWRGTVTPEKVISRQFWMCPSDTTKESGITLAVCEGPGKEQENGTIAPAGTPDITLRVALTFAELEEIAETVKMRLYALEAMYAVRGDFKRYGDPGAPASYSEECDTASEPDKTDDSPKSNSQSAPKPAPKTENTSTVPQNKESIPSEADIPDISSSFEKELDFFDSDLIDQLDKGTMTDTVQQTAEPETPAREIHAVTGKFVTDFQALNGFSIVQMLINGREFTIYFQNVPDSLRKAQEMGTEVTINIYQNKDKFVFDSLV